jgi:hypothetical protein
MLLTLDRTTARDIEEALSRTGGRIEGPDGAADLLAIYPHTLGSLMRTLGVDLQPNRGRVAPSSQGLKAGGLAPHFTSLNSK